MKPNLFMNKRLAFLSVASLANTDSNNPAPTIKKSYLAVDIFW